MIASSDLAAGGRRWRPTDSPVSIGAAPANRVVVAGPAVSDRHLVLVHRDGAWTAFPVAGAGPTFAGDGPIGPTPVTGPLRLRLGDPDGPEVNLALLEPEPVPTPRSTPPPAQTRVRIGRALDNDLVVPDLLASRYHAELRWDGAGWSLLDLGSPLGTYVDGRRCTSRELRFGQRLTFGVTSYLVEPGGPVPVDGTAPDGQPPALAAEHLCVDVAEGHRILSDVSFSLERGELLAIVGPSGSGKSTLLKALTGSRRPDVGEVAVRGIDLYEAFDELSRSIGYVPQDDILHHQLTVRDALRFATELRFPGDTTEAERDARVDEVLAQLELSHRAEVAIEKLSGGQRKRVNVALELLTRPQLLFLDEPTSGLDPGFERTVMELLRSLANGGRAVVVVTHSLQSLELCDRVIFLAPGGTLAFSGKPADALGFFGRTDFIDVFRDLEDRPPEHWVARRAAAPEPRPDPGRGDAPAALGAPPGQPWRRQVAILARRQVAIVRADRQNLWFLAGSVVVPSILILLLMGSDTLSLGQDEPVAARTILGAIVVAAVAIGAANAIREIVKELPLYLRERSVGVQRSAYLASKVLVIGAVTTVQAVVLVLIATLRAGGPDRANVLVIGHLELMVAVVLTGLAAVSLGLLLSTMVSTSEKAMALVPVIFVVQWLFSGASLDLQSKPVLREVAMLTSANWGMAASASTVDEHRISQTCSYPPQYPGGSDGADEGDGYVDPYDPEAQQQAAKDEAAREQEDARRAASPTCDRRWETGAGHWLVDVGALLMLIAFPILVADRRLARREPLEAQRAWDWPGPWHTGDKLPF